MSNRITSRKHAEALGLVHVWDAEMRAKPASVMLPLIAEMAIETHSRGPWVIRIEEWTSPTVNALTKGHWAKRLRVKKRAMLRVIDECKKHGFIPLASGKREVLITVYCPNMSHQPDPSNVDKAILDGLVHYGALIDDNQKFCSCPPPLILPGKKATIIELRDIE